MELERTTGQIDLYQPSGKLNVPSIPAMLMLGGILGIAAAFVVHLIWQYTGFYPIFFFPAGIGLVAGFGLRIGIKIGKSRNVWIGMTAGLIIGLLSYLSMHYFDGVSYGATSLGSYLGAKADEGYSLLGIIHISGFFAWVSWIIELGIAIFFTVAIAAGSSAEPYCEECDRWCSEEERFATTHDSAPEIARALCERDVSRIRAIPRHEVGRRDELRIDLCYCGKCLRNGYMTLTSVTPVGDGEETEEEVLVQDATLDAKGLNTLLKPVTSKR
jgi:hypothetical protein